MMLERDDVALIVVDVQGKLAHAMHDKELLFTNIQKLIKGIQVLGIPIAWAEQNPDKLGRTIPEIAELLSDIQPISKMTFSCTGDERFVNALEALNRKQLLIAGIEAHICVYQTVMGLVKLGYEVEVVSDATSSRTLENKEIGLERTRSAGGGVTSVETALFELLGSAEGEQFRKILKIVK